MLFAWSRRLEWVVIDEEAHLRVRCSALPAVRSEDARASTGPDGASTSLDAASTGADAAYVGADPATTGADPAIMGEGTGRRQEDARARRVPGDFR